MRFISSLRATEALRSCLFRAALTGKSGKIGFIDQNLRSSQAASVALATIELEAPDSGTVGVRGTSVAELALRRQIASCPILDISKLKYNLIP